MSEDRDLSTIETVNKSSEEAKAPPSSSPAPSKISSSGIPSAEVSNKSVPARPSVPPRPPSSAWPDTANKPGLEAKISSSGIPSAEVSNKPVPTRPSVPPRPPSSATPSIDTANKPSTDLKPVPSRPSGSLRLSAEISHPEWTPPEVPAIKASNKTSMEMKPGTAISPAPIWTPLETANKQAESPVPPWTPAETPFITQQEQSGPLTRLSHALPKHEAAHIQAIRERCRQLYLSVFFEEQLSVRSLGFTSALSGEGKTFLAVVTAEVLANDTSNPVTLVECNWEHPCFHNYFKLPSTPGLAEWLRGECAESAIRHQITRNLTVIPAGNGRRSAVKLLRHALQKSVRSGLVHSDELLIVDLPPIVSTAYGSLAASMVESLVVVVRAQVTSEALVIEACEQLKHVPIHGIVLNQINSRIPRWLQQIL